MEHISRRGHTAELQILDNKASGAYKDLIAGTWKAKYQLVPPDFNTAMHMNKPSALLKPTPLL